MTIENSRATPIGSVIHQSPITREMKQKHLANHKGKMKLNPQVIGPLRSVTKKIRATRSANDSMLKPEERFQFLPKTKRLCTRTRF